MENALLVTDTKFSSRERSRVGKYNRPPSLPAFPPYFYAPSAPLRKERTSLKLSPFLPCSIRQTANLAAFLQPPSLSSSSAVRSGTSLGTEEILLPPSRG